MQWFESSRLWLSTLREISFEFKWGQGFSFANSLLFCNWLFKVRMFVSVLSMWCGFASRWSIELHSSTSFTVLWFNGLQLVQADYRWYPFSLSLSPLYHQNTSFGMNHRQVLLSPISCLFQVALIQPALAINLLVCNWLIKGTHVLILNIYLTPADNNPNPPSLAHFPSWSISPAHFASITLIDYSFLFFSLLQLRCLRFIRFLFNTNLRSVTITSIYCMQF